MKLKGFTGTWPKTSEQELPGYAITDLRYGMCKWALTAGSPYRFCGEPAEAAKPYCAECAKRAYWSRKLPPIKPPYEATVVKVKP